MLRPLRLSIQDFLTKENLDNGVLIGLRFGSSCWRWFGAYIEVKKPEKPLCYELGTDLICAWRETFDELSGNIPIPQKAKLSIPELFDGGNYPFTTSYMRRKYAPLI